MNKAVIFSAPSGSGKTTIVHHMLQRIPALGFSISASTRQKRTGKETTGKDYYFISVDEFKTHIEDGDFIEWEEVYSGAYYGTLKQEVQRLWDEGKCVVFDVDVEGGLNLKKYFGDDALAIFVKAPSIDALKARLMERETETEETLNIRLSKAKRELEYESRFDVAVLNSNLDEALNTTEQLINKFLSKN